MKKKVKVVAAIICRNEKYLAVQRGVAKFDYVSYKWEFPGGKVEAGESLSSALERELHEELNVSLNQLKLFTTINHEYPDFHITMDCFLCEMSTAEITLKEHINFRWLNRNELLDLDWAEADIPAVKKLFKMELL